MSLLASYGTGSDSGHAYGMSHQQQQRLEPKRPCYPDHTQLPSQAGFANTDMYGAAGSFNVPRSTPFSLQEPGTFQVPAAVQPFMGLAAVHPAHMMAAGQPELHMPPFHMPGMQQSGYMQQQQQQQQAVAFQPPQQQQQQQQPALQVSASSSATHFAAPNLPHSSAAVAAAVPPGSLRAQMQPQHQANMRLQQQQQRVPAGLRLAEEWRPMAELQRLLPRLNQEYKREMSALLKACQVAGKVTKTGLPATPSSNMLLLDPAAREQLQHQVLSNCNDKHAAVTAAFRVAAQAVAAAASSSFGTGSHASARAAAAAAVEVFGGGSSSLSTLADAAGELDAAAAAAGIFAEGPAEPAPEAVSEALQQLRTSYHQELVAATSALFAICRGFGQTTTLAAAASQPIKAALAAAQQQHVRVEQLWQDVLVVAAGHRE